MVDVKDKPVPRSKITFMIKKMTNKYLVTSHIIFFVNRIIHLLNCHNKIEELVLSLRVIRD